LAGEFQEPGGYQARLPQDRRQRAALHRAMSRNDSHPSFPVAVNQSTSRRSAAVGGVWHLRHGTTIAARSPCDLELDGILRRRARARGRAGAARRLLRARAGAARRLLRARAGAARRPLRPPVARQAGDDYGAARPRYDISGIDRCPGARRERRRSRWRP